MDSVDAAAIPLFAVLGPRDRERVLKFAKRRTYQPGDVVVHEGDQSLNLYVVASGHARVERADRGVVGHIKVGDFFGELGLIEDHERTATVIAEDELTCVLLPAWEFRSLLKEHPVMAVPMLHALIARIHGVEHHPG